MATFIPISPGLPTDIPVEPNLPQFTWNSGSNLALYTVIPISPLPGGNAGAGAFAMSLAPLVLPFLALLSWWFK